jgi:glycine/D-amino acid oxidase-like deaminating enzyme
MFKQTSRSSAAFPTRCDIAICGGGIAGLWLLNRLMQNGYDTVLLERGALGGIQTIASQGMIHGGQRYLLDPGSTSHAKSVAPLPERWDACLSGTGEIDLREVRVLSETQVMWSTGGLMRNLALRAASLSLMTKTRKLAVVEKPAALSDIADGHVYGLPEKVLDVASLSSVLAEQHAHRIYRGDVESVTRNGQVLVSGASIDAEIVICAAGVGNKKLLGLLGVSEQCSQHRPIRQVLVKAMPYPLFGHAITTSYRPQITVTSYPLPFGGYVWYVGGALAEYATALTDDAAIEFAKKEMCSLFKHLDWGGKQWATWYGIRAEAFSTNGRLPDGPIVHQYDRVMAVWPTKLTLVPLLGDLVLSRLNDQGVAPKHDSSAYIHTSCLDKLPFASHPWEHIVWRD